MSISMTSNPLKNHNVHAGIPNIIENINAALLGVMSVIFYYIIKLTLNIDNKK